VGMGGDPVTGVGFTQMLEMYREDERTKAVVMIGEIGGNGEELAAQYIRDTHYPKPVAAYIAGRMAPPGKRMGHAGAIVMGTSGTAESKIEALTGANVLVADKPSQIVGILKKLLAS